MFGLLDVMKAACNVMKQKQPEGRKFSAPVIRKPDPPYFFMGRTDEFRQWVNSLFEEET